MGTHQSKGATLKKETQFLKISTTNSKKLLRKIFKNSTSITMSTNTSIETNSERSSLTNPGTQSSSRTQTQYISGKSYYDEKVNYVLPNNDDGKIGFSCNKLLILTLFAFLRGGSTSSTALGIKVHFWLVRVYLGYPFFDCSFTFIV